jgi:hypothetical protein
MTPVAPAPRKGKARRPKADVPTIISMVLAVVALGWAVYAYLYPRPTPAEPNAARPPVAATPSASTASPTSATDHQASGKPGLIGTVTSWWHSFNDRVERDRHGVPWWQLVFAWCLLIGYLVAQGRDGDHPVLFILVGGGAYMWYFWPSWRWFGDVLTPVATMIAVLAAAVSAPVSVAVTPDAATKAEPSTQDSGHRIHQLAPT